MAVGRARPAGSAMCGGTVKRKDRHVFIVNMSCLINRPLKPVFEYVADFRNAPSWQPQLAAVRLEDGPFPAGRTVTEIHHFLGVRIEATGQLVDWQPLAGFVVRGRSGLIEVESRYAFAA